MFTFPSDEHLRVRCSSSLPPSALFLPLTMKTSAAVIALATVGGASAYSVNRSTLRSLGQKNVGQVSASRSAGKSITMEGESVWGLCLSV